MHLRNAAIHSVHTRLDAGRAAWFASSMKIVFALLFVFALVAPAAAGDDYRFEHRPPLSFKKGPVHISPYPQSGRSMTVWNRDACWNDCKTDCNVRMAGCTGESGADACRP